jgi:HEAT repeat protein
MTDADWERLLADLCSPDVEVNQAVAAVEQLDRLAEPSDVPRLRELLRQGKNFFVREAAATPLARLEGARALPWLFEAKGAGEREGHDNDGLCFTIMELLQGHPEEVSPLLLEMLGGQKPQDRRNAAWASGFLPAAIAAEPLLAAVRDSSPGVRSAAVGSLASIKRDERVLRVLLGALQDPDEGVRISSAASLGYFGDQRAVPALRDALRDPPRNGSVPPPPTRWESWARAEQGGLPVVRPE